jgi:16S rRNA (cytosine967-C5)-methyltransferase
MTDRAFHIREIALEALMEIFEKGTFSHLILSQALQKYQYLSKQDRSFLKRLVEGCVERRLTIDYILGCYSQKTPVEKMKPIIRNILRLGLYQIRYMDGVPDSAACNESVKLAQKKGFGTLKGFVNGILRAAAREKERDFADGLDGAAKLSFQYAMPEWVIEQWTKQYGEAAVIPLLEASLKKTATTIRVNLSKDPDGKRCLSLLAQSHVTVEPCPYLAYAFYISDYDYLDALPAFREGLFLVQDLSSMLVAEVCDPAQGSHILDLCAAPGGKALHLADKLQGTGLVRARDLTLRKVQMIEANRLRCGYQNVKIECRDALEVDSSMVGWADIVVVDLPCSGLGVLSKKGDIKYNMTPQSQRDLVELQRKILSVAWQYVKPGGILLYSTCTLNRAENEENVHWFQDHYPFQQESLTPFLPHALAKRQEAQGQMGRGCLTILPEAGKMDGFFLAKLRRLPKRIEV